MNPHLEKLQSYLDVAKGEITRLDYIVSQFLQAIRPSPPKLQPASLNEAIRASLDLLGPELKNRHLHVEPKLATSLPLAPMDASQIQQVLVNLIKNAMQAMTKGGTLTLTTGEGAGGVWFSVNDTGGGIPQEQINRIFEPFYTTKAVGKGTGLGLSQVYGFAKQSGGDVRVDSLPGQGATFTLYLPRANEALLAREPEPQIEAVDSEGSGRILVVEDNENVGEHASQLLRDLGYETVRAPDAPSALRVIEEAVDPFDLVLSDIVMPGGMSGLELARHLATTHPQLPVVLTTGYSDALAEGGAEEVELLRKPYSMDALGALMRRLINKAGDKR